MNNLMDKTNSIASKKKIRKKTPSKNHSASNENKLNDIGFLTSVLNSKIHSAKQTKGNLDKR